MNQKQVKTAQLKIQGMTCGSCEIMLEHKLKKVPGILTVNVNQKTGIAHIEADFENPPSAETIKEVIKQAGYKLSDESSFERYVEHATEVTGNSRQKWLEIGASLIIIIALYKVLQVFNIIQFASQAAGAATLGGVLLIGLVAGTSSCLAVTGGLLLSIAAKYNETHQAETRWQKFKPLLYFNTGRLGSYFIFGGLVGILGKSITLSPRMTGYTNIIVAAVMIYLALSLLKIIPKGSFGIRPPKRLSHWIANLSESKHPASPLTLGAFTFFLPCGFTQSLQLVALASGSFLTGAMTMFVFALGTLPALLGISTISVTAKGRASRLFLRFSGTLVLILGFFNLNSGLLLTGVDTANLLSSTFDGNVRAEDGKNSHVTIDPDGTQIINMRVKAYEFSPNSFTIAAGKPTLVRADADPDIVGCTSVLTAPEFGLTKFLRPGEENELGPFIPTKDFILTCSMGMVRAQVNVYGNSNSESATLQNSSLQSNVVETVAQIIDLTWTNDGYNPRTIEAERGKPTIVRVSAEVPTGGCMSTIVFPQFNQSAFVPPPGNEPALIFLATENAEPGYYPVTCGMGIEMGTLRVK